MATSPYDCVVGIGCGNGADLQLTKSNDLVAVQVYAPGLRTRVNFGRMTEKRIDDMIEYLNRLRVHAVE